MILDTVNMFGNGKGAWDEVAEAKANIKYKDEVGIQLVPHEVYGLNLEVLRSGRVLYHMGVDAGFRPSYSYLFTEEALAKVLQCTQTRVHHAVTRLKLEKPNKLQEGDVHYPEHQGNIIYQGKLYIELRYLDKLLEDLSQRRPYLNSARTAYQNYLESSKEWRKQLYFGRQGVLK